MRGGIDAGERAEQVFLAGRPAETDADRRSRLGIAQPEGPKHMARPARTAGAGRARRKGDVAQLGDQPRNVEPEVHKIDNVYVFNVDDLEQEVARGLKARHAEVEAAEKIVEGDIPGGYDFYYAAVYKEGVATARAFTAPIWMDDH